LQISESILQVNSKIEGKTKGKQEKKNPPEISLKSTPDHIL
jgi:hypothetical protein